MHRRTPVPAVAAAVSAGFALTVTSCGGSSPTADGTGSAASGVSMSMTARFSPTETGTPRSGAAPENEAPDGHDHASGGQPPTGIRSAASPAHPVGTDVVLVADHLPGMKGATATVRGAYDTRIYMVDYTPKTGGAPVRNHKWVVQEEIAGAGSTPYAVGDRITLTAEHLSGMNGAMATIRGVTTETVYMVDYTPTTGGDRVTHHLWVVESELAAS